ncbi:MAG: FAD/NAD(P)-binding protein [Acetobacteraceae bacterium]|nr:FAD/NAD(P)-binding protein [Acetobacteraceae bacterium]
MTSTSIAVIGAGFSGTLLSLHLLRRCPDNTRIVLIERNSQFGRGQAYSTGNPSHLLNVPAGRMSAFHDRPMHFVEWLRTQPPSEFPSGPPNAQSFVPRRVYGAYIRSLLGAEIRRAPRRTLELIRGEVLQIERQSVTLRLVLDRGRVVEVGRAVLAIGNFPPEPMKVADPSFYDSIFYRPDPWAAETLTGLDAASPVVLIGTGLTMVDMVISLLDQGHRGPIHAVSRRGLLPRPHAAGPQMLPEETHEFPIRVNDLLRFLRQEASAAKSRGTSWQAIVDELRPFTQDVWQTMPLDDRKRFLRHLRPWWEVHRHRMPCPVAQRIEAARASGQLHIHAGRISAYEIRDSIARVILRPKGSNRDETIEAARVIACSGPNADYSRISHPLVRSLLAQGVVRPDPLRLGLDVTPNCALLNREGAISRRLFAVGPVTKSAFWEMTAVPDIRRQCEFLAQHLASLTKPPPQPEPTHEPKPGVNYAI